MNTTNKFLATADSVGDWDDCDLAAKLWNRHIVPVLNEALHNAIMNEEQGNYDASIQHDSEWAWEEFCGRSGGESEKITMAIASELKNRLGV